MALTKVERLIKKLSKGTLRVKKKGSKYHVTDVVEYDGDYGLMDEKELIGRFG